MKGTLFGEKDILALGDSVLFSVLKEEMARYALLPKIINLSGRLNGFFDSDSNLPGKRKPVYRGRNGASCKSDSKGFKLRRS